MLTIEWFNKNMPEKVETQQDQTRVLLFLSTWAKELEANKDVVYEFVTRTDKKELLTLQARINVLLESVLDYNNYKVNLLTDFLTAQGHLLSIATKQALQKYWEDYKEVVLATIRALKTISQLITITL